MISSGLHSRVGYWRDVYIGQVRLKISPQIDLVSGLFSGYTSPRVGVSEGLIAFYAARVANVCLRVNYGPIVKPLVASLHRFFLLPFLATTGRRLPSSLFHPALRFHTRAPVSFLRTYSLLGN